LKTKTYTNAKRHTHRKRDLQTRLENSKRDLVRNLKGNETYTDEKIFTNKISFEKKRHTNAKRPTHRGKGHQTRHVNL